MLALLSAPAAAPAAGLSSTDLDLYRAAFRYVQDEHWDEARRVAAEARDQLPAKVIQWLDMVRPFSGNGFSEITAFIRSNPDWPNQTGLERQAEATMPPDLPAATVKAWFGQHAPVSAAGVGRYAEALSATGDTARAQEVIRRFWVDGSFVAIDEEIAFHNRFRAMLRDSDTVARLDRLLWDHQTIAARRLLPLVDDGHQAVAQARLALADDEPGLDAVVRRVPVSLAGDTGLAYERLHWLRRKDNDAGALEGLAAQPARLDHPALWWAERNVLARRLLARGQADQAYRLVKAHGLTDGQPLAEAEFLAGWLALRYLQRPSEAFEHFYRMFQAVSSPMSRARGAYWCGRAAAALGDQTKAQEWYEAASRFPTMFYGQLAVSALGPDHPPVLPAQPSAAAADVAEFERRELVRVVRALHEIDPKDGPDRVGLFLRRLGRDTESAAHLQLLGQLAVDVHRPDLGIFAAKQAFQTGMVLPDLGYPTVPLRPTAGVEPGLALAVIRQESTFNPTTVSAVGARGLMQLMPSTAQSVAGKLGLPYAEPRLLGDPDYNITLGTAYLGALIDTYGGSYLLAVAAYNAGSGRVRDWLGKFGDPRAGHGSQSVDPVDWVESIPITETRNYVQRVLEALEVYRVRLGQTTPPRTLKQDLVR